MISVHTSMFLQLFLLLNSQPLSQSVLFWDGRTGGFSARSCLAAYGCPAVAGLLLPAGGPIVCIGSGVVWEGWWWWRTVHLMEGWMYMW